MIVKRFPVTADVVLRVKKLLDDPRFQALTLDELGVLAGTSGSTVSRVKNGKYDHLLDEENAVKSDLTKEKENVNVETLEVLKSIDDTLKLILEVLEYE